MSTSKVQRTYGSRGRRNAAASFAGPSSPPSVLASSPPPTPSLARPSKRSFSDLLLEENIAPQSSPSKRQKFLPAASKLKAKSRTTTKANAKSNLKAGSKTLTQLHFNIDQSIMRTCSLCNLSYTRGAPDDESLHRAHCTRARQGMEWGREEEKDKMRGTETVVVEVASGVKLKGNKKGRIISFPASIGGKIGSKVHFSHAFFTLLYLTLFISWTRSCRRLTSRSQHRNSQNRYCNAPRRISSFSRTRPKAIANASWAVLLRSTFPLRWPSCHRPRNCFHATRPMGPSSPSPSMPIPICSARRRRFRPLWVCPGCSCPRRTGDWGLRTPF